VEPFPPWTWRLPARFNIGAACTDAQVAAHGARAAVIVDDDARGVRQHTYASLADASARFHAALRSLDVAREARVLVRLPNCLAYATVFLGAMKRGAVPVPTSTQLTADEVRFLADDSGAAVLVTDAATWTSMRGMLAERAALRHVVLADASPADVPASPRLALHALDALLAAADPQVAVEDTAADDPAYLVYTSGTTSWPKGVLHAHRALLGRQPASTYWFDFLPGGDRVLHAGKYNWTYTLGTGLMDPLFRGHTTIVCEGSTDAALWPARIARHAATTFIAVPTVYRQILQKTAAGAADVPSLRHCMSAGEQLPEEVLLDWRARFRQEIYEGLGMTECSYYLCETRARPIRPGSAGFVQPGHDVRVLDPTSLAEVPVGEEGMLCVRRDDPNLLLRYWNRPEETAAAFRGDWFLTGDWARLDADGYVWFLGRRDDVIKSFGYRVSPHEVERVLREHPDVVDAGAVGEAVATGKTLVAAYVVLRPGATLDPDVVREWARTHLAGYKAPKVVYVADELPRTRNGKLRRQALRAGIARARSSDER
jgi:acetyl-CoA synthetase